MGRPAISALTDRRSESTEGPDRSASSLVTIEWLGRAADIEPLDPFCAGHPRLLRPSDSIPDGAAVAVAASRDPRMSNGLPIASGRPAGGRSKRSLWTSDVHFSERASLKEQKAGDGKNVNSYCT